MAYTTTEITFEYEQVYDVNTAKDGDSEEDKDSDLFFFFIKIRRNSILQGYLQVSL